MTGAPEDRAVTPTGPALVLMGGSREVDEAFAWWRTYVAGGDVVILRTSGSDGYNDYLFSEIGGVDSVETLLVTSRQLANDPYVTWRIRTAEGIFMAGGDQSTYVGNWKGTGVEDALHHAWDRGAVIGGTSAGCAVLGEFAFAATGGSVGSEAVLLDPYEPRVTLERDFLRLPPLAGVLTDSHFARRDRMGRLIGFLARVHAEGWSSAPIGLGVDERTALVIGPDGVGQVMGSGAVYLVRSDAAPSVARSATPLQHAVTVHALLAGAEVTLPQGVTSVPGQPVRAAAGALIPDDPY